VSVVAREVADAPAAVEVAALLLITQISRSPLARTWSS